MENLTLEIIKTMAIVGTAVIAAVTIIKGYAEYRLSAVQKRVELFEKYRQKMKENEILKTIIGLLEQESADIRTVQRTDRYFYLGYFEEIALLVNSRVLKPEIAHYMFAYYAKLCWANDNFWHDINRDSIYWRVFREFVEQMIELEEKNMTIPTNQKLRFKI